MPAQDHPAATLNHEDKEKIRQNSLIPINKLPNELLRRIIRFIDPVTPGVSTYTWVCHHWRSVLVQSSVQGSLTTKGHVTQQASAGEQVSNDSLQCDLTEIPDRAINRLAPVLRRISKLSLTIDTTEILHSVLDLLHNNANLHTLELLISYVPEFTFSSQTLLPELWFLTTDDVSLLDGIRTPKLSTLDIQCSDSFEISFENPSVLQEFGCSSIQYLHVYDREDGGHTILGLKKSIHPTSVFSLKFEIYEMGSFLYDVNEMTFVDDEDYLSDTWTHDCLRLNFITARMPFDDMLKIPLYSILPHLTGLLELCLASDTLYADSSRVDEILAMVPSLEVLIILHNEYEDEDEFIKFIPHLGNTSLCPRLKHLSYMRRFWKPIAPEMAEDVGKLLTKSLTLRHEVYGDVLKHVVLGNCSPLPDAWLKEIQKLGTTVVADPMPDVSYALVLVT